jgi:hypothetical protein
MIDQSSKNGVVFEDIDADAREFGEPVNDNSVRLAEIDNEL